MFWDGWICFDMIWYVLTFFFNWCVSFVLGGFGCLLFILPDFWWINSIFRSWSSPFWQSWLMTKIMSFPVISHSCWSMFDLVLSYIEASIEVFVETGGVPLKHEFPQWKFPTDADLGSFSFRNLRFSCPFGIRIDVLLCTKKQPWSYMNFQ